MRGNEPFEGVAVRVLLGFWMPFPKATPKYVREADPAPAHTGKPDLDNMIKAVLDAVQGVVFKDDSQVASITASKWYERGAQKPGVSVIVRPL